MILTRTEFGYYIGRIKVNSCLIFIRWISLIYINSTCSMKSFLNSKGVYRLSVLAGQAVECRIKHLHTAKHYVQQIGAYFSPICPEHKTMWLCIKFLMEIQGNCSFMVLKSFLSKKDLIIGGIPIHKCCNFLQWFNELCVHLLRDFSMWMYNNIYINKPVFAKSEIFWKLTHSDFLSAIDILWYIHLKLLKIQWVWN